MERTAMTRTGEGALEELKRELNRPSNGPSERPERKRPGRKKDKGEGLYTLPCADMTCPCRVIRER